MLDLSRCTLLFVETRAHDITKRVIEDCLRKADFGDVLIYSDQPERIQIPGARYEIVPDFPNKKEAGQFYYSAAMAKVETDFALMMEWDAGICDVARWKPEFLSYDYVGAPWNVQQGDLNDVGNGGFTLMSKRLGHFLVEHRNDIPVYTDWDVCRTHRQRIEQENKFTWAPFSLARDFSWELVRQAPSFGFHGAFRWIDVLDREELVIRARMMTETPYLRSKMHDIFRYNSVEWLEKEIGAEAWAKYREVHPVAPVRGNMISPNHRVNMMRLLAERQTAAYQNRGLKA